MKVLSFFVLLVVLASVSLPALAQEAEHDTDFMQFDRMVMHFEGTEASVTVTYDLDTFARMYVLAFGTRHLESFFETIFSEYEEVEIMEIGYDTAVINLKNVSRLSDNIYFHDSRNLGTHVDVLEIVYPDGTSKARTSVSKTTSIYYYKNE